MDRRWFLRLVAASSSAGILSGEAHSCAALSREGEPREQWSADGRRVVLTGDYGYQKYVARDFPPRTVIDAREASFTVANSRNANPSSAAGCDSGDLEVNHYPVDVRNCPGVRFVGAQLNGEVPMTADWKLSYCNSTAILIRENSIGPTVEGVRIRRCWDGIRIGEGSGGFHITGSWLSEVRDDPVENDYLLSGTIDDCLFEGCFSGISIDSGSRENEGSSEVLTVDRLLMRMEPFLYKDEITHGSPFKTREGSPSLKVTNSVFALTAANMFGIGRLRRAWETLIESRNNVLLWLADEDMPDEFPALPSGFTMIRGDDARTYWNSARQSWIGAHPEVRRFSDDC